MPDLRKCLDLERLEYMGEMETKRKSLQEKIKQIEHDHARRGILRSGATFRVIAQTRGEFRRDLILTRIDLRRRLSVHEPELLSDPELDTLQQELERGVQAGIQAQHDDFRRRNMAAGIPDVVDRAAGRLWKNDASGEVALIQREIAKLRLQRGLGMEKKRPDSIVLNITNSIVGGLNLGSIIGDMNATLTTLEQQGNAELASALKALSEAVAADDNLGSARREVLENISVLGEEGAVPAERRRMGVVKAAYKYLGETIAIAGHAAAIWETWGPQIAAFFGLPH